MSVRAQSDDQRGRGGALDPLFDALVHCNNAKQTRRADGRIIVSGDPTETALLNFAMSHGLMHRPLLRRMGELAFDADRKRMTTLHWSEGHLLAFTKGAPESLLPLCRQVQGPSGAYDLTPDGRKKSWRKAKPMPNRPIVSSPSP
ncbi:MAG: hypothetical protein U0231_03765 [Nitrospiraceae bacterium]